MSGLTISNNDAGQIRALAGAIEELERVLNSDIARACKTKSKPSMQGQGMSMAEWQNKKPTPKIFT